jgi:hypothetical protein
MYVLRKKKRDNIPDSVIIEKSMKLRLFKKKLVVDEFIHIRGLDRLSIGWNYS